MPRSRDGRDLDDVAESTDATTGGTDEPAEKSADVTIDGAQTE